LHTAQETNSVGLKEKVKSQHVKTSAARKNRAVRVTKGRKSRGKKPHRPKDQKKAVISLGNKRETALKGRTGRAKTLTSRREKRNVKYLSKKGESERGVLEEKGEFPISSGGTQTQKKRRPNVSTRNHPGVPGKKVRGGEGRSSEKGPSF